LAKTVTTLDVLSGGRAWLGIGAAWNEAETRGLGIPFPPIAERFERLEETLQICLTMWEGKRGSEKPFPGKHYQLGRPLNVPQSLSRPHPPILIGGGGERKTLRMVAQYADACNLFPSPELPHKLDVLRGPFSLGVEAYWPRPPEMLQKTFLTWLPRMISTTMTTTAIKTRIRAYSTIPCPSSRLSSARRRRYRFANMVFTSRLGDWSQSASEPGTRG